MQSRASGSGPARADVRKLLRRGNDPGASLPSPALAQRWVQLHPAATPWGMSPSVPELMGRSGYHGSAGGFIRPTPPRARRFQKQDPEDATTEARAPAGEALPFRFTSGALPGGGIGKIGLETWARKHSEHQEERSRETPLRPK